MVSSWKIIFDKKNLKHKSDLNLGFCVSNFPYKVLIKLDFKQKAINFNN